MKRKFFWLIAAALFAAAFFLYEEFETIQLYAEGGKKEVFEVNTTNEQLMNQKRSELLKDSSYSYHKSSLKLSPYVLIDAKYVDEKEKSREGHLLWSQVDGEIVLDTDTWQTTHGFFDALLSDASREDFLLIHALIKKNGSANKDLLRKDLKLEKDAFEKTLKNASSKNLVVLFNDVVKLHLEDPKIINFPVSHINHPQDTREVDFASIVPKRFSLGKIQKIAKSAFGKNFTIRSSKEVFLPIWKIEVKKPDNSLSVSYWNAVNGWRIDPKKAPLFD